MTSRTGDSYFDFFKNGSKYTDESAIDGSEKNSGILGVDARETFNIDESGQYFIVLSTDGSALTYKVEVKEK